MRSVVITGASTGIGESCAHYLADRGFHVFAGVRKQADADRRQRDGSSHLVPVFIDGTEGESIVKAAETVTDGIGDNWLAGLFNNTGGGCLGTLGAHSHRTTAHAAGN